MIVPDKKHADPEFDNLAHVYDQQHRTSIRISGEEPAYFAEYKVRDLFEEKRHLGLCSKTCDLLDFGCGTGNSIFFLQHYFQGCSLKFADASSKSIEVAKKRVMTYDESAFIHVTNTLSLPDDSQDIVFSACVFHHILPSERAFWLQELYRVTRPSGMLMIYEHNPLNPVTLHAVKGCSLDDNAVLLRATELKELISKAGWSSPKVNYRVFFPSLLKLFRPVERYLAAVPFGAQYYVRGLKKSGG